MFEEADNFADLFRGGIPYCLLIALPILIICSGNPVLASSEFTIQRMSQYDVHGIPYGCRASAVNLEAKSLHTWKTSRHCIVTRFQDMTIDQFREIRAKAGGLIILLPKDITKCSLEEKQHIYLLEQAMMAQEISIPVYFSKYTDELNTVIEDISSNDIDKDAKRQAKRDSAISEIINSVSANGYQVVVSGANHAANKQSKIPIIQGELAPIKSIKHTDAGQIVDGHNKLPLIIVTAHLNTFGLLNTQLSNVDIAVFMSIVDVFSKIHSSTTTAPKYRLMFLLSESGNLLNFQGMKKWLELDENMQLQIPEFVLCIDGIGHNAIDDSLYMHVSKPPKDGSQMNNFYKQIKSIGQTYANVTVEGVHKKINLADVQLAWEHERFSMKRMPAFTLSSLKSHKDPIRSSIFENSKDHTLDIAQRNAKIIAESLATYIYGNDNGELFSGSTAITKELVKPWLHLSSSLQNNDIKNAFEKYLKNVKITNDLPEGRDPDFMLYTGQEGTLNVYSVKPAVFDLFLTFAIVAYLGSVYLAIVFFPDLYGAICKLNSNNYANNNNKVKAN